MTAPTASFAVRSMSVHTPPIVAEHQTIYANMAVEYGPLLIVGAALARSADGEMRIWLPNFGRHRRVVFQDATERARLLQLSIAAYRALTGCDLAAPPLAKAPQTIEAPS